ncbi:twin-arginine translocase TatA/TatE family subunit (plasmid) [Streptomyces sp. JL4002]|uniref:twin-arginine translocase TatA/TatE family subunit n=1 Tax=Streptomyces sp. JL4002 TaxID=3404781 RepID=UPI003B27CBF8
MLPEISVLKACTILIVGLLVFGPDKLPKVAEDVTAFLRGVRSLADHARREVSSGVSPELQIPEVSEALSDLRGCANHLDLYVESKGGAVASDCVENRAPRLLNRREFHADTT